MGEIPPRRNPNRSGAYFAWKPNNFPEPEIYHNQYSIKMNSSSFFLPTTPHITDNVYELCILRHCHKRFFDVQISGILFRR